MKKKKVFILTLIFSVAISLNSFSFSFAESTQDKADDLKDQKTELAGDLADLEKQIKSQQSEIDKIEAQISSKEGEISSTEAQISKTESDIADRKEGLSKRLRTMYKNGSVGYLDVLLGSNSISEFLSNIEMVQKIYRNDQKVLNTLEEQEKVLEEQKSKLAAEKTQLDTTQSELTVKQAEIKKSRDAIKTQYDQIDKEYRQLLAQAAAEAAAGGSNTKYDGGAFKWPSVSTSITSPFGYRYHPIYGDYRFHDGIDIGAGYGTPIYAAADGVVTRASAYGGYGNVVIVSHGSGLATLYAHCSSFAVGSGQTVKKGQVIAYVGSTGWSTGAHLHFTVIANGQAVNPMNYF